MINRAILAAAILMGITVLMAGCGAAHDTTPVQPEPDTAVEAARYEQIIAGLKTLEDSLTFPDYNDIETVIPDEWYYMVRQPAEPGEKFGCLIAVPKAKDLKTGLTVESSTEGWVYVSRTSYMDPNTSLYICSDRPRPQYEQLENGPPDFSTYPRRENIEGFGGHLVFRSPYYIPQYATHGLYIFSAPALSPDSQDEYRLQTIIRNLAERNPYLTEGSSTYEPLDQGALTSLTNDLSSQAELMKEDIELLVEFLELLEMEFFIPNEWCWDKQSELHQYRSAFHEAVSDLLEIKSFSEQLRALNITAMPHIPCGEAVFPGIQAVC